MDDVTQQAAFTELEGKCREIVQAVRFHWQWDERFEAALLQLSREDADEVMKILEKSFVAKWTASDLEDAPSSVKELARALGGLWEGQILFTSDPNRDPMLIAAWWPWGDSTTISVRTAYFSKGLETGDEKALAEMFKGWFGL